MQSACIGGRHQDVRCPGVDNGGLSLQAQILVVHTCVVCCNLPATVADRLRVQQFAGELGRVDAAKSELPVVRAVGGTLQMDAQDIRR